MKKIFIGKNADGQAIYLSPEMRQTTHTHIIGGTRTGKSKFLEWMMRKDIREGHGFCLIDWHGSLYHDILRYCSHLDVGLSNDFRKIVLIDPSKPDFVTGFNPFMNAGEDISTQVNHRIDATVRPWGGSNTDEMPTFERTARVLYTFMAEAGQTLPNAANLLNPDHRELRDYAMRVTNDDYTRDQLRRFQSIKSPRDWEDKVLSMENRLSRFIGSTAVRRFMGMTDHNIDLLDIMDSGKILLVNLGASGFLDRKAATVFASLLLYEFMDTAMQRAVRARGSSNKPKLYPLYLDEFQNYITDDIAEALDQALKGGLHLVLAHQHLGHFADNPKLKKSVFTNARIRAVFGGLDYEDACILGNEMFLTDLNSRQIKKAYYHTIHVYDEQTRVVRSHSHSHGTAEGHGSSSGSGSGSGSTQGSSYSDSLSIAIPGSGVPQVEGWSTETRSTGHSSSDVYSDSYADFSGVSDSSTESESDSYGETIVPVWVPIPQQELTTEAEWGREEKLSKVAQLLKEQMQQHCFIKLDREPTEPLLVPFVKDYAASESSLLEYQQELFDAQGALPAAEVDRLVEESQQKFLAAASEVIDITPEEHEPEAQQSPPPAAGSKSKRAKKNFFDDLLGKD